MTFSYFPGCTLKNKAKDLDMYAYKSADVLGVTLEEIEDIMIDDEELDGFLFTLGCYSGEPITVISRKRNNCVVSIKDGRYNIDSQLAEAIII